MQNGCFCYLDDIVVVSEGFAEHLNALRKVFKTLREAGLAINKEKSHFCRPELKYLGHVVTAAGIAMDPEKVSTIVDYPAPRNVKELKSFLGLVSWYRKYVPNFADVVIPLTGLLKKKRSWNWSEECQNAFDELKLKLISAPILACPDFSQTMTLQTDASFSGLGAVLTQGSDREEKVIAYASRALSEAEKKYSVTEKELLAALWAVRKFRPYLEGYHFVLCTDHYALKWINSLKNPSGRLARWALELQDYSFTVVHRKGTLHQVPDALSRINVLGASTSAESVVDFDDLQDKWYVERRNLVQQEPEKWPDWRVEGNRLYHLKLDQLGKVIDGTTTKWKLVVPKNFREKILGESHDLPTAGHLGITKTFLRIAQTYFWPGLFRDVVQYVKSCDVCQVHKVEQQLPRGQLRYRKKDGPWVTVTSDILGPYPRTKKGHRYIVVFQDYFTKWVECKPLKAATAKSVLEAFQEQIILRWGLPSVLLSDNGPQYVNRIMSDIAETYHLTQMFTPYYCPQANPTERVNRVLKTMISAYLGKHHADWDLYLREFAYALNTTVHSATGYTPAYLNLGRELKLPSVLDAEGEPHELDPTLPQEWAKKVSALQDIHLLVRDNLEEAYKKASRYYNLRHRDSVFKVGDLVLRKNYALSSAVDQVTAGLMPKYLGPFKIKRRISPVTYELEARNGKIQGRWHIKDLKPYHGRS
jgi:transposase